MRNFINHCNRAITFQALQSGGRPLFIADQQHTQSFNVRHAATGCFCSGCSGLSGCFGSRLHRLLGCSAALAALAACPLWLLAFIPYAKVKKLILTHYILFIWKDRCMFFSDAAFPSRMLFSPLPDGSPWQQHLCHSAASRHRAPASSISATAAPLVSSIFLMALRLSAPASNKPHPAEKSTPVWLAIWRTWAGFANSQHRDAALATPDNICAHSSLLQHGAAAQIDANLSAHLHRLPTPPSYLRRMRLLPGLVRRCWMQDEAVA